MAKHKLETDVIRISLNKQAFMFCLPRSHLDGLSYVYSSSVFLARSMGFPIFGEIFACVTIFH